MKKIAAILSLIFCLSTAYADGTDPDWFSDTGLSKKFETVDSIANQIETIALNNGCNTFDINNFAIADFNPESAMPGRMPTFLFTALVSAVGTYTLYGAGAGPIAVAIVYACKHGDRHEVKLAIYGCLTGAAVGGLAKWLSVK